MHTRSLFLIILVSYYENIPDHVLDKLPDLNIVERSIEELGSCIEDIQVVLEAADDIFDGSFLATMSADALMKVGFGKWAISLKYMDINQIIDMI